MRRSLGRVQNVDIVNEHASGVWQSFPLFSKLVVLFTILLIWWGAATTTKQAGMAFPDWPLSFGSVNPEGWLNYMVPFLEHSHRLLGKWVGILVLVMFAWSYVRSWRNLLEVVGVVLVLATVFGIFIAFGAEREDAARKQLFLWVALATSPVPIGWLIWSWTSRGWSLVQKLCATALLMVTTQAIFGGVRVTEISNAFAVVHGCFAQAFFCLLILIVMVASKDWVKPSSRTGMPKTSITLVSLVYVQLIIAASMRHFHRYGLVDTGILTTQGELIPEFDNPVIVLMFLHKLMAVVIMVFTAFLFVTVERSRGEETPLGSRYVYLLGGAVAVQIILGISVIMTGKNFWITNFHVLNGLAILAFSFSFAVKSRRGALQLKLANS